MDPVPYVLVANDCTIVSFDVMIIAIAFYPYRIHVVEIANEVKCLVRAKKPKGWSSLPSSLSSPSASGGDEVGIHR